MKQLTYSATAIATALVKAKAFVMMATTLMVMSSAGCSQLPSNVDLSSLIASSPAHNQTPHHHNTGPQNRRSQLFAAARQLEQQGKMQPAIEQYQKVIGEFPDHVEALRRLAVLQDTHGDANESSKMYLRAMHFAPKNPDLLADYGYSRYVHGDLLQAETMLRRAIGIDEKHARSHTNLGLVLAKKGEDQKSLASFQRAGLSKQQAFANLKQVKQTEQQKPEAIVNPQLASLISQPASDSNLLDTLTSRSTTETTEYSTIPGQGTLRR